jgi:ankyrin repeat protein
MGKSNRDPRRRGGAALSRCNLIAAFNTVAPTGIFELMEKHTEHETDSDEYLQKITDQLEGGEDISLLNAKNESVLIACAKCEQKFYDERVAELLVEWGADPYAILEGKNAIQWAAYNGNTAGAKHLEDFIEEFFMPTTITSTTSDVKNTVKENSATTVTTITTTITTAIRTVKRPKLV